MLKLGEEESVELGMHIHPWLTPPRSANATCGSRESYLANLDLPTIRAKLQTVWNAFDSNNCQPVSFRGGRYSSGPDIQNFLQQKGFIADASIVPYTAWVDEGSPNYRDRDIHPNRLQPLDQDGEALWEIPVTLGFTRSDFNFWSKTLNALENSPLRYLRLIGIMQRVGIVNRVWLNFEDTDAKDMIRLINVLEILEVQCICLTVHSSSLYPGGNSYSDSAESVARIWKTADTVMADLAGRSGFTPATIGEIATTLETAHESHRD